MEETSHQLSDILTSIVMDHSLQEEITDMNSVILQIVQYNLISVCESAMIVTDDLNNPADLDVSALIQGLVDLIKWIPKYATLPSG